MLVCGVQRNTRRPGLQIGWRAFDALLADSGQKQPVEILRRPAHRCGSRNARLIIVDQHDHPVATGFGGWRPDVIHNPSGDGDRRRGMAGPDGHRGRGPAPASAPAMTPRPSRRGLRISSPRPYKRAADTSDWRSTRPLHSCSYSPGDSTDRIRVLPKREQDRPVACCWCPRGRAWGVTCLYSFRSVSRLGCTRLGSPGIFGSSAGREGHRTPVPSCCDHRQQRIDRLHNRIQPRHRVAALGHQRGHGRHGVSSGSGRPVPPTSAASTPWRSGWHAPK